MDLRLGSILVARGVLDADTLEMILEQQRRTGEPLGPLAVRVGGACPLAIEDAWAWQVARRARRLDPSAECVEPRALAAVSRRQAWQFRVLPIRFEGTELMVATIESRLRRSLGFAANVLGVPVQVVLSTPRDLAAGLCAHYPWPGMSSDSVFEDGLDEWLALAG
ncbi:MAG: GspE/PulE/PilB domain-containing protein [Planctomycetota bacterium]|jgi:hypothetical protein